MADQAGLVQFGDRGEVPQRCPVRPFRKQQQGPPDVQSGGCLTDLPRRFVRVGALSRDPGATGSGQQQVDRRVQAQGVFQDDMGVPAVPGQQ